MISRFGLFSLVGALGALVQVTMFGVLVKGMHWPPIAAMPVAVELAVLHNFLWHERFTWRDRTLTRARQRLVRFWRFHLANGLVSVAGNTGLAWCLVEGLGLPALWSAGIAIAVCAPVNYFSADRWVFS